MKKPAQPRWLIVSLAAGLLGLPALCGGANARSPLARGGRVGWARLVTGSPTWQVHSEHDPLLAAFIRTQTSLNIDPVCYPVDPGVLEKLCAYPFVFTNNLTDVSDARSLTNLREYLRRGGFIYIDRCVNLAYSLEQELFYRRHIEFFTTLLPGAIIRELPDNHEIYQCYFTLTAREKPAIIRGSGHSRLYGVFDRGRMVILLSNENLQCGWPNSSSRRDIDMKMIANIYVYAMTRANESALSKP